MLLQLWISHGFLVYPEENFYSTEVEYIVASVACREAVWLWKLHDGLFD